MLTGAEILVKALEKENVEVVFCYPGGANLEILDCLRQSTIKTVLVRHEQGAAHEASGYARVSGRPGVCLTTSGPGATNLITGIATAGMDSVPLIAITGQVATGMVGTDAFQEVDVTGITDPITKHNYLVKDVDVLAQSIREAFYIAASGRPGPVLLDIPRDVAMAKSRVTEAPRISLRGYKPNLTGHQGQIKHFLQLLKEAQRPVIIAGGGILCAGCWEELKRLAELQQIPVANTLMGLGSIDLDHPLALGMMGVHGLSAANRAVQQSDLIIALGTRFSDRMSCRVEGFAPMAKIVHIDVDPAEIGKNVRVNVPIVGDLKIVLNQILEKLEIRGEAAAAGDKAQENGVTGNVFAAEAAPAAGGGINAEGNAADPETVLGVPESRKAWLETVAELKKHKAPESRHREALSPITVIEALDKLLPPDAIVTTDVGQHQLWAAQRLRHKRPRGFIASGGLGTMGYGIPAAIGAQMACPDAPVVVISGDGSFQMGLPELGTAMEQKLPLKILLLNNSYLGMVKQLQDFYSCGRYTAVEFTANPDFEHLALAYGALYLPVKDGSRLEEALTRFLAHPGLAVLEARVTPEENVYPMVLAGASLDEMTE